VPSTCCGTSSCYLNLDTCHLGYPIEIAAATAPKIEPKVQEKSNSVQLSKRCSVIDQQQMKHGVTNSIIKVNWPPSTTLRGSSFWSSFTGAGILFRLKVQWRIVSGYLYADMEAATSKQSIQCRAESENVRMTTLSSESAQEWATPSRLRSLKMASNTKKADR